MPRKGARWGWMAVFLCRHCPACSSATREAPPDFFRLWTQKLTSIPSRLPFSPARVFCKSVFLDYWIVCALAENRNPATNAGELIAEGATSVWPAPGPNPLEPAKVNSPTQKPVILGFPQEERGTRYTKTQKKFVRRCATVCNSFPSTRIRGFLP